MQKVIDVHIGQVKVAKDGETLRALLGSCVGIGIIWKERKLCGLAHCLLPESPQRTYEIGGRFVDQALRSLLALMKIRARDFESIDVIIVGGGNMTGADSSSNDLVGLNNFRKAMAETKKLSLKVTHSEGGGVSGRKVYLNGTDFTFRVEEIPRIDLKAMG